MTEWPPFLHFFIWRSRASFLHFLGSPLTAGAKKYSLRIPGSRQAIVISHKKEAAPDCDTPIFHTIRGYFFVFLVSNILATSLSADFSLLCRSRDSQSASSNGFSSPSSKVRHAFGRRSRWRIPSSCIRFPFLGSFLYVTDLHPLWL